MSLKQLFIISLISLIIQSKIFAQSKVEDKLIGNWMGNVKMGDDYARLVFEVSKAASSDLKGTVGSPDKGIKGIPLSSISFNNDSVVFEIKAANAVFKGVLSVDKKNIAGLWQEGDSKQDIVLKSVTADEIVIGNSNKNIKYKLQFSNSSFNFYLEDKDLSVINDLAKTLTENYLQLTEIMKTNFSEKIDVIIYPDIKTFHKAINLESAPDWVVGAAGKNELKMVSPLNPGSVHNYESLTKAIVHELCHTVIINMREQGKVGLPKWLDEGFAFYYAKQLTDEVKKKSFSGLSKSKIPTWDELNKAGTVEFGNINGYVFSASIIEFLVNKYGYESIRKLILNPYDFENIFGIPQSKLENEWINNLTK